MRFADGIAIAGTGRKRGLQAGADSFHFRPFHLVIDVRECQTAIDRRKMNCILQVIKFCEQPLICCLSDVRLDVAAILRNQQVFSKRKDAAVLFNFSLPIEILGRGREDPLQARSDVESQFGLEVGRH